jgi:tRNA-2-methylthio-N6-dimethylallyladenosine synthase
MRQKRVYINTIGCQMNVHDSERMAAGLQTLGYRPTVSMGAADLIIANTCAIRAKAEQKVFSFLGRLAGLKRKKPELIIAVGGCVAQQEGRRMLKRLPHLDLVFGTHALGRLPALVQRIEAERCRLVDVEMTGGIAEPIGNPAPLPHTQAVSRFVTVMQGCDNYCTYCVVPYVRGREVSRPPEAITDEVRRLVAAGAREVTLLGQNVNSYGQKEGLCGFPELLRRVNDISGLKRIRFTTSHPKDLSQGLVRAFGEIEKLCPHIHLPVQSGSNRILRRMNRKYTREIYLERIGHLRAVRPDIAVTSDFIVGFPGEGRDDFEATLSLISDVQFDGLFAFIYSDRPSAPAARFADKVPEAVKQERLQALLELQEGITLRKNRALVGTVQEVLVEGTSKRIARHAPDPGGDEPPSRDAGTVRQWTGRNGTFKIVHFCDPPEAAGGSFTNPVDAGMLIPVEIERAFAHSLRGSPAAGRSRPPADSRGVVS